MPPKSDEKYTCTFQWPKDLMISSWSLCTVQTHPTITDVIYNDPATIVFWSDKTKTVVKTQNGDPFDKEKGLALAMAKKLYGNKGNFNNEFHKWCK